MRNSRIFSGYLASLVVSASVLTVLGVLGALGSHHFSVLDLPGFLVGGLAGSLMFSFLPFVICMVIAERAAIRSLYYYLAFAVVPGLFLLLVANDPGTADDAKRVVGFLLPSLAGGFAYWVVAGQFAGQKGTPAAAPP